MRGIKAAREAKLSQSFASGWLQALSAMAERRGEDHMIEAMTRAQAFAPDTALKADDPAPCRRLVAWGIKLVAVGKV